MDTYLIQLLFSCVMFACLSAIAVMEVCALLNIDIDRYMRVVSRRLRSAICSATGGHRYVKVGTEHIRTYHNPEDGDYFEVSRCERRMCGQRHYELVYEGSW
jgi:hypothetical protein